jgi:hypothetical protein
MTVQNLRLRIQPKLFCNAWKQYGDYPQIQLPDKRTELALGDLVSGEERYVVLMLEVLPFPLLPDGSLPASLEGKSWLALNSLIPRSPKKEPICDSRAGRVRIWSGSRGHRTRLTLSRTRN